MNTVQQGNLGKSAVVKYLMYNGYEVFTPFTENSSCDLIVVKDSTVSRVEVKSTRQRIGESWAVELKSVRPNRTGSKIKAFDGTRCDILAAYIVEEDRVVLFDAAELDGMSSKRIRAI